MVNKELELRPIQREFVERITQDSVPQRYVLTAPTGMGKSTTMTRAAKAFQKKHDASILVVVPGPTLVNHWHRMFAEIGVSIRELDGITYRQLQLENPNGIDFSDPENSFIVTKPFMTHSMNHSKKGHPMDTHFLNRLMETPPGMIIFDEVHLYRNPRSRSANIFKQLWVNENIKSVIANTGTLDSGLNWLIQDPFTQVVQWELSQFEGITPLTEGCKEVTFGFSRQEKVVQELLWDLVGKMPADQPMGRLLHSIFKNAWESSVFALQETVLRWHSKDRFQVLGQSEKEGVKITRDGDNLTISGPMTAGTKVKEFFEHDITARDFIDAVQHHGESMTLMSDNSINEIIDELKNLNSEIEQIEIDSKWECCKEILVKVNPLENEILIMTRYARTATYLQSLCQEENWDSEILGFPDEARDLSYNPEEPKKYTGIKIVTDARCIGMDLRRISKVIHYDVPSDPRNMVQRLGRTNRFSVTNVDKEHYLLINEGFGGAFADRLFRNIEVIDNLIGTSLPITTAEAEST